MMYIATWNVFIPDVMCDVEHVCAGLYASSPSYVDKLYVTSIK